MNKNIPFQIPDGSGEDRHEDKGIVGAQSGASKPRPGKGRLPKESGWNLVLKHDYNSSGDRDKGSRLVHGHGGP